MPDGKSQQPGDPPDFAELLARAEALVPVLRERASHTEELRQLPEETIEDLHRTGLFRILHPNTRRRQRIAVPRDRRAGVGDRQGGWLDRLGAGRPRRAPLAVGMWPKQAQDEVWASRRTI